MRLIESKVGRERFDLFLKNYFTENAFKTMTTEKFLVYLDDNLLKEANVEIDYDAWVYGPGLPDDHPIPESGKFDEVDDLRTRWLSNEILASDLNTESWTTHQWLHFLRGIPGDVGMEKMRELDSQFGLTQSGNSEIAAIWFERSIQNDYKVAFPALESFLLKVGRRKFLKPLYLALAETEENKDWARGVYANARGNYHAVSVNTIDEILDWEG